MKEQPNGHAVCHFDWTCLYDWLLRGWSVGDVLKVTHSAWVKPPAGLPWSVTDDDRRQTTTDARVQTNTAPPTLFVGGPIISTR